MWFDCRKMIIDNKILTWSTLSFYVKITTHGDFLFIKKKAKGNWYNVEIQKKVTFINIDNLPNRNEWTWLWISTPACLESVMVHILIEKKDLNLNLWCFSTFENNDPYSQNSLWMIWWPQVFKLMREAWNQAPTHIKIFKFP